MRAGKERIGLVLASIHTGAAQNVWPSFAKTALIEDKSLFIFPGGRLNARMDSENLRNSVYSLVNSENLDGCISWSSAIRYTEPEEEFEEFHSGFSPLPYVTLFYKIQGRPCVQLDSYTGMKLLTSHCISVHGARKIAFIRGPVFHQNATARLKGFQDALKEAGLNVSGNNPLVTDPFNWNNGDAAAAQLFENRKLRPGQDFDTLICSSDLMALGATKYFARQGYHIPADYHAAGFNNSVESRLTESPLSTVHIPYSALASESFRILMKLLKKKKGAKSKADSPEDILLPFEIIIRESCGCAGSNFSRQEPEPASLKITDLRMRKRGGLESGGGKEETLTEMIADYFSLNPLDSETVVTPVIRSLLDISPHGNSQEAFLKLFENALVRFFDSGRDTELLFNLVEKISRSGYVRHSLAMRLEPVIYRTIFKVQENLALHSQYEKENWNTAMNSLKCELLGTRDRNSLVQSLARHLPKIGINAAGIALYGDYKTSIWVGSFSLEGISPVREHYFPARLLVPDSLNLQFSQGIFMVQPLFIENQSLGYFIHSVPIYDGVIFEELRSAVSYALKGIFQFAELVRAKRIAEQAEWTKTEFLRTLENELYNPLAGVMERIEELKQIPETAGSFRENFENLKSFVASREERVENLIELAISGVDKLVLKKTLFDPEEMFPEITSYKTQGAFPLISGDTSKLSQCFSFIREEYSGSFSASISYAGLELNFRAAAGKAEKNGKKGKEQILLLSERIILMHGGEFKRSKTACDVILPWPDLTGKELNIRSQGRQEHILALSGLPIPAGLSGLPVIQDPKKAAETPGRTAFIIWNSSGAGTEELLKVSSLQSIPEFKNAAFLCYGNDFAGEESVFEGVEKLLRSPKKGTFLFIGGERRENLENFRELAGDEVFIPSMPVFNETVTAVSPRMIFFNSVNTEGAAIVRRHPITVTVPIIMMGERIDSAQDVMTLSQYYRLIICHRPIASSPEFRSRLQAILAGAEILPPHTGALVKKTILYFDQHVQSPISRWKLAETVNVNEDYLTRIFHREMGLSLWDYLNRLRVYMAVKFLLQTNESIQEIASHSGFQDQAYFCRVFKKVYGIPPGQLRKQQEKSE
jgi:DNA-binding LacI/PurR family transcriptional regulator/AraC-like DNA-binding protein